VLWYHLRHFNRCQEDRLAEQLDNTYQPSGDFLARDCQQFIIFQTHFAFIIAASKPNFDGISFATHFGRYYFTEHQRFVGAAFCGSMRTVSFIPRLSLMARAD
jgi:hypothetical protein